MTGSLGINLALVRVIKWYSSGSDFDLETRLQWIKWRFKRRMEEVQLVKERGSCVKWRMSRCRMVEVLGSI